MNATLARRLAAEAIGTGLLATVVAGSGIAATRLTGDAALRLFINSTVTALGLAVLILMFAPAGGAHFNPVVTAADWLLRRRYRLAEAAAVVAAQVAGAAGGIVLAEVMFAAPVLALSQHHRNGLPLLTAETVATAGLLLVIVTLARTGRTQHAPWAVGAWIGAAYWFTSSTSFANPALTFGRMLTSSYAGIAPASVLPFIAAQILGGTLGALLAVIINPAPATTGQPAQDQTAQLAG